VAGKLVADVTVCVCLMGLYLKGVHLMGAHLTVVHLMNVQLTGVHLIRIHFTTPGTTATRIYSASKVGRSAGG
jgi:hypothetical protein